MKINQNIKLYSIILGMCVLLIVICSFMMPKLPTYTEETLKVTDTDGNDENNENNDKNHVPTFQGSNVPYVVIDPGHGGYDEGGRSSDGRIVENEFDMMISNKIKVLLEKEGVKVLLTRTSDEVSWPSDNVKDLQARLDIATNAGADMMISIHCNSSDEDPLNVSGSEVYANSKQTDSVSLAQSIVDALDALEPELKSRGVKKGSLHLLTFNTIPTVIVEMGFLSNPKDVDYLLNSDSQNLMCEKIAEGIINELKK